MLEGHGAFFSRGEGLAFQTQFEHLLREDFANLDDEVFEFSGWDRFPRRIMRLFRA
jgi:hypothetical protein